MNRHEIENKFIKESLGFREGPQLCGFTYRIGHKKVWDKIWKDNEYIFISDYFYFDSETKKDYMTMSYLCRALTLNMILDDNNIE
jgi:hypothetical protein